MSNRIELKDQEAEEVVGGILDWDLAAGIVYPEDQPDNQYTFADYDECKAWLVVNWHKRQNAACLVAMEQAGLVQKI